MTRAGRKERTDISGAEMLCSRISAPYKDDTSKSNCLYLNGRQILARKKKKMTGPGLVGLLAPCGCSDLDVNLPQELCHMPPAAVVKCSKNHRNIIFQKVANALQLRCPSLRRNHGSVFVADAPNQQNLKILPKPNPLFTSPTFSGTFPTYRQRRGICHKSGMGRSIKANHAGLSD